MLLGPRRVGKTSLAKCAIKKASSDSITIDARENNDFASALLSSLMRPSINISGSIGVPNPSVLALSLNYSKEGLKQNLDKLLQKKRRFILLLEAQWFRNSRQVVMLLAHIYDYHHETVTPIITGSAVGVMKSILEPRHKSALYGRPMIQMEVKKWTPSTSLSFLTQGLRQYKMELDDESKIKTVSALDGLPGWLTIFGYYFTAQPDDFGKALRKTLKEALKIVDDETSNIAKSARGWNNHYKILSNLASGDKSFKDLSEATMLPNSMISDHLDMLQRLCYVEKDNEGRYRLTDPVLAQLLRERKAAA